MTPPGDDDRRELRADCARCAALCCVAPTFERSADFAISKPAGRACPNLLDDFRCGVHAELRERGMPGCTVFDCFGAGQQTVQVTFGGADWRSLPQSASTMFAVFTVLRPLQEVRWYLAEAAGLVEGALRDEVTAARERLAALVAAPAEMLVALDVGAVRAESGELLSRVSAAARAGLAGRDLRNADRIGRRMRGDDLRGASLRGAYLIATDLRGADLRQADLLGADLRAADLRGADLSTALFVTQPQLAAARGDATTRIPAVLTRPPHWRD